jgi:DNA-binding LacI/PurR family transcriptional regulator
MATRRDVAEKAGVSVAAVTRALTGSGYVSEEKRDAVLRAAEELEYRPDPIAVSLKKRKTHQLVYYIQDLSNYYYMEMYRGMVDYAAERGYMVITSKDFSLDQVRRLMVDGVLLPTEFYYHEAVDEKIHVSVVIAGYADVDGETLPTVNVDVRRAVDVALDHLLALGHRRVAFAPENRLCRDDKRLGAFKARMRPLLGDGVDRCVLGPDIEAGHRLDINYFEHGVSAADDFIDRRMDSTAIVCFNDDTAIGLMNRLQARGIRVPEDVSVVGIDGHLFGAYASPALTTVSISPNLHGRECARLLISLIEGGTLVAPERIEPYLIERRSVRRLA